MKQKLTELKGQTDKRTITVENFNTSLSKIDKATRQKISKDIKELTINQQDLIDIYTHSSQNMLQTFFSSIPNTNMKMDHILSHRTSLNKFKRIAI